MSPTRLVSAAALAAVAVLTTLGPGTAHADVRSEWIAKDVAGPPPASAPCTTDSEATTVCYQANGDILWVRDGKKDKHHAEMVMHWFGGQIIGWCSDFKGKNAGWTACNVDIQPENERIFFYAQTMEGGEQVGRPSEVVDAYS